MRESQIEKYLCDRVKELGGEVRKVQWIGRRGAPDRLVMLPAKPIPCKTKTVRRGSEWMVILEDQPIPTLEDALYRTPIWVELKAPGEKAKPHQVREHERMRRMGQRVVVVDSIEGVEELLR